MQNNNKKNKAKSDNVKDNNAKSSQENKVTYRAGDGFRTVEEAATAH